MLTLYRRRYPMLLTFGLFLSGLIAAGLVGFVVAMSSLAGDAFIRSMGGTLQLGGLAYVLYGLTRRGAAHKVPISWRQLSTEVRILLGKTKPVSRSVTLVAETGSIAVSGDAVTLRIKRGTIEGRVEELERMQQEDRESIRALDAAAKAERGERVAAIDRERSERVSAVQDLQRKIKDIEIGTIYLEWVGVLWIMIGIVFATWASELTTR